jgi:hypothetical protein
MRLPHGYLHFHDFGSEKNLMQGTNIMSGKRAQEMALKSIREFISVGWGEFRCTSGWFSTLLPLMLTGMLS